jgi:putative phosphoesterase
MRLVVFTDVHANMPALDAALSSIHQHGYDVLVHTGDAIGIGPFPAECIDRLLSLPNAHLLMGNHDSWFTQGLPEPRPSWMSDAEVLHQQWTHAQLKPGLKHIVVQWPYVLNITVEQGILSFMHYPLTAGQEFMPIMAHPTEMELDRAFSPYSGDLIFYGHHHPQSDIQGHARYINPGSLGCATTPVARYCVIDIEYGRWIVEHKSISYDDTILFEEFEKRGVPERKFIYKAFFGGRFTD